jgi:predicted ferric reductase
MKRSPALSWARLGASVAYAALALAPAVASYLLSARALQRSYPLQLGLISSLLAYPLFALQLVLAARLQWLDRLFGLDKIYSFHKAMAVTAGALILVHPLLLALDMADLTLLLGLDWPWYVLLGKLALFVMLLLVFTALLRRLVYRSYERWRLLHNPLSLAVLAAGAVHALQSGRDLAEPALRGILLALLALGAGAYLWHKLAARRRGFRVAQLQKECPRVWRLSLMPAGNGRPLRYLPGQFQFLTLEGGPRGRREEHPFTISSASLGGPAHESTIKESGDFTSVIGHTTPDTPVRVRGPFGRFSYLLYPEERDFVFLAGGIGITPFMAMLRHMAASGSSVRVLLLYANRTETDIAFRGELDNLAAGGAPLLRVVHVLEQPPDAWGGESGRITQALLERHLPGPITGKAFYLCGPPPMMRQMMHLARRLGVPRRRLHWERFAL